MADPSVDYEFMSEIEKMGFMKLKKYVKAVGLELPSHVTKPNLLKLIGKEKKFKKDPVKDDTVGASPSSIEVKKAVSPRMSRAGSNAAFDEASFLKGSSSGLASKACKLFRGHFGQQQANKLIRPLQNAIFAYEMKPELFEKAIMVCDYENLDEEFVLRIYHIMEEVVIADWGNACGAVYELEEDAEEKYHRFFTFVSIPQVRDRILSMGELFHARQQLNVHHEFTHHVHKALHEIVYDENLVRYLMAVLLFTRAKKTERINLNKLKLDWNSGKDTNGVYLLRRLLGGLPVTAQDLWLAKTFDQIDESKPRIRMTGLGAIMKGHIDKQKMPEEAKVAEVPAANAPPVALDALMSELTKKTTKIAPLKIEHKKRAPPKKLTKEEEHEMNLKRLEFRVPNYKVIGTKARLEQIQRTCVAASLDSHDKFLQDLFLSYDRLAITNEKLMDLWSKAESNYFHALRTDFMKRIRDPQFIVITNYVEEEWDLFLPDTVWGTIWEYRAPFEKNIDLRFALEVYKEFMDKYGL